MAIKEDERACPYCHLTTRKDNLRCVHCGKSVLPAPKEKVAPIGRVYPIGTA